MKKTLFNSGLWGVSIALSWTWGLGLFFSVQMAIQFGLGGLLMFAIPNALGLMAFGWFTRHIAKRKETDVAFERHFLTIADEFRWVFLFYQVTAIALSFFALFKYAFLPLELSLAAMALLLLGAGLLLGEQFDIRKIKWSHFAMALVILVCILLIGWGGASYFRTLPLEDLKQIGIEGSKGEQSILSFSFAGYLVPIVVGFLLGPWLDLQQWQRAIRIRRENSDIGLAYTVGGALFFGLLLFHGTLALAIWGEGKRLALDLIQYTTSASHVHAKDAIIQFLFLKGIETPLLFRVMYVTFLCLCIVSTLDSGYVALKWFQADAVKKGESLLFTIIPKGLLTSPIPPFVLAAFIGLIGVWLDFELEYYMAIYGSFLVGYAMVFLFKTTYEPRFTHFTQTTLVSLAMFSLGVFGFGYFHDLPILMIAGAIIPLVHAIVCINTRKAVDEIRKSGIMDDLQDRVAEHLSGVMSKLEGGAPTVASQERNAARKEAATARREAKAAERVPVHFEGTPDVSPNVAVVGHGGSSWVEGKKFVHRFVSTYQDTNSVGNVYFAQYAFWVGKTRELFFHHAMPNFDLKNTPFFILTRSYEHKFLKESREFEEIEVQIHIADVNRKFVTMEHSVFNGAKELLGKGKQVLLFVSSKDYRLLDIPVEAQTAFLPYL